MSTTALICTLKNNGKYDGIPVNFDGYLEGVGRCLIDHWTEHSKVEKFFNMCFKFDNREIRSFGDSFETTEFYPCFKNKYTIQMWKKLTNMTLEKLENMAGNYDFTYVWDGTDWYLFDTNNNEMQPVRSLLSDGE